MAPRHQQPEHFMNGIEITRPAIKIKNKWHSVFQQRHTQQWRSWKILPQSRQRTIGARLRTPKINTTYPQRYANNDKRIGAKIALVASALSPDLETWESLPTFKVILFRLMLRNYLKILFRNIVRNKTFSIINLLGLSTGLTCFLLIGLYVQDELSFDRFHEKGNRVYQATIEAHFNDEIALWAKVPNRVGPTAAREIPEVEKAARIFPHNFGNLAFVSSDSVRLSEQAMVWADPEIFDILSIPFLKGNPATALTRPNTAVMSEDAARKYFGSIERAMGKTLSIDNAFDVEITGIYRTPPANSRFQYPVIGSFISHWFGDEKRQSWSNASFETFILTHNPVPVEVLEQKLNALVERNVPADSRWYVLHVLPLPDIHLYSSNFESQGQLEDRRGDIKQIRILITLGIIILLIAAVNYMNLSTAQSQRRFKEIGISKTLGATGPQLARQFYFETSIFVLLALLLSLQLTVVMLPFFNYTTGKALTTAFLQTSWFWSGFAILWLVLSLISGFYPALYLSSFSPKRILKSAATAGGGHAPLRKALVVIQFTASIILIISAVILYRQLNYVNTKSLGYKPDQVVAVLTAAARDKTQVASLRAAVDQLPGVKQAAMSQAFPGIGSSVRNIVPEGQSDGKSIITVQATTEIVDVLGVHLLAGKSLPLNKEETDTTVQVVINASAAEYLGFSPQEAVGRYINIAGFDGKCEVMGVTEDFHFTSLHTQIGAYCFHNARTEGYGFMLLKLDAANIPATMARLEKVYRDIIPSAFVYTFLDERVDFLYRSEYRLARVILIFACMAIVIACLGLYALAAYTTEQRTKEIGVRKVLGASVLQLSTMLSREFLKLVLIAFIIAAPIGYYLMNRWLQDFAYHIDLGVFVFLIAGAIAFLIAWITVGVESIKAARANPVESLRNE